MKKTVFQIVKGKDLTGKVFLITGGYSGLGAISTKALLSANATVIVAGRNESSQLDFVKSIDEDPSVRFGEMDASHTLDLGSLESVRNFANYVKTKYSVIHCLINNAGVMFTPAGKTRDGFEVQFGTNVIGHFLLAKLLVDITKRQVWLSSKGHTRLGSPRIDLDAITKVDESEYDTVFRYQQSKLGDILLAKQFDMLYPHLRAYSVHPGVVKTNLGRHMSIGKKLAFMIKNPVAIMTMKEPEEGAMTQVMVAILPESDLHNGAYYADCKVSEETESARNMEDAKMLFDYCDNVTKSFQ